MRYSAKRWDRQDDNCSTDCIEITITVTMVELRTANRMLKAYAVLGYCVASYALYVEISLEKDPGFKPLCDVVQSVKCSPAFVSRYAKGFGIVGYLFGDDFFLNVPNGLVGMLYYATTFVLSFTDDRWAVTVHYCLTIASNLSSFYLAFVLALIIRELCLVCLTTYLINAASVVCVVAKLRLIESRHPPQKPKSV